VHLHLYVETGKKRDAAEPDLDYALRRFVFDGVNAGHQQATTPGRGGNMRMRAIR
jgi:hypothetical protein